MRTLFFDVVYKIITHLFYSCIIVGDPKKDWKDVADFLKELHPDKFDRSSPFDSEILDLIDLLYNRNNNHTE
jgi:hypothetical protein